MAKVAIIGAGSVVFCQTLMEDIMATPGLEGSEFALMAPSTKRTAQVEAFAKRVIKDNGLPAKVWITTDQREAVKNADYVIATFQVGGVQGFEYDYKIPLKYGVDQCIGDTMGPGGIFRTLRTVPAMIRLAHDMEELCPNAYLLNYVNPMAMICWALGTTKAWHDEGALRRPVPRCADNAGPDLRIRRCAQDRDRLPVRGYQPHGVVSQDRARRARPLSDAASAVRTA